MRLCDLKLSQAAQKMESLEIKLQEQSQRRDKVVRQLHNIMEVQWKEALNILNNRTPSSPEVYNEHWNQLKSKSYSNLEELLSTHQFPENDDNAAKEFVQTFDETPVSSKPARNRQQIENELQKYIQMVMFVIILLLSTFIFYTISNINTYATTYKRKGY